MRDRQYGSEWLTRACRIGETLDAIEATDMDITAVRVQAGLLSLAWYRIGLPTLAVRLTASPAGRMIEQHLSISEGGRWRYRHAQAVLTLPNAFSSYWSGRQRQAARTNVNHARRAGLQVTSSVIEDWGPGPEDTRIVHLARGPVERWMVLDPEGSVVADSVVTVDREVALLHGLVARASYSRWMLHSAIVQRLCGHCQVLLTNCDDAYLLDAGTRHFQRLLGYRIARLSVAPPVARRPLAARVVGRLRDPRRPLLADWR